MRRAENDNGKISHGHRSRAVRERASKYAAGQLVSIGGAVIGRAAGRRITWRAKQHGQRPVVAKVWRHCQAKQVLAHTVTLKIKFADFQQVTRSCTVSSPFSGPAEIEQLAFALLDPLFPVAKGIRLIGVTVSTLDERSPRHTGTVQLPLL